MELWLLRSIHISSAVLWAGWAIFAGWFLLPAILEAGAAGGAVMGGIVKRRYPLLINVFAILTLLTGFRLYMINFSSAWLKTGTGILLSLGALLAIGGFAIGTTVARPTTAKITAIAAAARAAGGPPTAEQQAEMGRLMAKAARTMRVISFHALGAAVFMAFSRYAPF